MKMKLLFVNKKWVLNLLLSLVFGSYIMDANATDPEITRVFPENTQEDTIYLRMGAELTFTIAGYDADGNLKGAKWYKDGSFQSPAMEVPATTDTTFTKVFTFDSLGSHSVTAWVYDVDNNYNSTPLQWNIKVVDEPRAMYATISSVAGVPEAEDSLIAYALENNIRTLFTYGTNHLVNSKYQSDKERLSGFVSKAKTAGIEKVIVVAGRGQNLSLLDSIYSYQSNSIYTDIDGIVMEFEYWNDQRYGFCANRAECFDATLEFFEHAGTLFSSPGNDDFKVGIYLGNGEKEWGDRYDEWFEEAGDLIELIDFALLHYYTPQTGSAIYLQGKIPRLQAFLDASTSAHQFELMPLFSMAYADYHPHNNSGLNNINDIESWWFSAFQDDSLSNKYQAKLTRPAYFTYAFMDEGHIYPPLQRNFRRVYKGNTSGVDTTYIELGDTLVFLSRADDYKSGSSSVPAERYPVDEEGDLRGAEWYVNGKHYTNTMVPAVSDSTANVGNSYEFEQEIIFDADSVDTYRITVRPFDWGYHYSPRNIQKWVVIQPLAEMEQTQEGTAFLNAYPNPFSNGKIKVSVQVKDPNRAWIRVYSMTSGGLVFQKKLTGKGLLNSELDLAFLTAGNYLLKVYDGNQQINQQIIKQ